MLRTLAAVSFAALLLVIVAPVALPQSELRDPARVPQGDGVWRTLRAIAGGSYVPGPPPGVAFDPSRHQLVYFTQSTVVTISSRSGEVDRAITTPPWGGLSAAATTIYDPRGDRVIVLAADATRTKTVSTFALTLGDAMHWERLVPIGNSPNLLYPSAIYDPVGSRVIIYGGVDLGVGPYARGDVWALSLGPHPVWSRVEPSGPSPAARQGHSAIYDPTHRAMVVFGGRTAYFGDSLGDTWSLDLWPRPRWRPLAITGVSPAARAGHTAVYDARRARMLIKGSRPLWPFGAAFDDLWALSLSGRPRWRQLDPEGTRPSSKTPCQAFADLEDDRMVVASYSGSYVWALEYDGNSRRPASGTGPGLPDEPAVSLVREGRDPALSIAAPIWRGSLLTAHVTIPGTTGATLGLFDLSGRRVELASRSTLQPGVYDVTIATAREVASGVYFLRLEQDRRSAGMKVVRVR